MSCEPGVGRAGWVVKKASCSHVAEGGLWTGTAARAVDRSSFGATPLSLGKNRKGVQPEWTLVSQG